VAAPVIIDQLPGCSNFSGFACSPTRKVIHEEKGQVDLGWRYRYFFFVTNDRHLSQDEVIAEAHDRCNQENVIEQLEN
jgi:hypothetical protein